MITIRKSQERGHADHGWLKAYHSFSFADYYDPNHMGYRALRVINEDRVQPGQGFATHPHKDMEILTYVVSGALAHKDSMGNGRTIRAGELQMMSAGSGITHSEFNPSMEEEVRLLQIWILPERKNLVPSYAEWKPQISEGVSAQFCLLASGQPKESAVKIHQDVSLYLGKFKAGARHKYSFAESRYLWIQLIDGQLKIDQHLIHSGDALAVSQRSSIEIEAYADSQFLLFDLN